MDFADRALRYFVDQGKFTHSQLAQLWQQSPRVKLSIARSLEREHHLPIKIRLHPVSTRAEYRREGPPALRSPVQARKNFRHHQLRRLA
jgi:hypothetical protein